MLLRTFGFALAWVASAPSVDSQTRLEEALAEALRQGANALMVDTPRQPRVLMDLAERYKLPAVYTFESGIEAGGLMYYGRGNVESAWQAASFIDRILRGAKPAEIPFEAPSKLKLTINLRAAKAIGLTMPQSVLIQADRVID